MELLRRYFAAISTGHAGPPQSQLYAPPGAAEPAARLIGPDTLSGGGGGGGGGGWGPGGEDGDSPAVGGCFALDLASRA